MPRKRYLIDLTPDERDTLVALTRKGEVRARKMKRAQVLLRANGGATDTAIMQALGVSRPMVERLRKRFVEGGLEQALNEAPRPGQPPKLNGKQQARLIAEACSTPPEGRARWTLQLLADRAVTLGLSERLSYETVRRVLKKTAPSPG